MRILEKVWRTWAWSGAIVAAWLLNFASVPAATVTFDQTTDPPGFFTISTSNTTDTSVSTTNAPLTLSGYNFTHWTIGVRTNDAFGRSLNPVTFQIYDNIDAVANYTVSTNDLDADGVPDWFEIMFYSSTNQNASSDSDGDGFDLNTEYRRDYHPGLKDLVQDGGISRRRSSKTLLILMPNYFPYSETSIPDGFASYETAVSNGNAIASTNLNGDTTGYSFGYWDVNGAPMTDSLGVALSRVTTVVTGQTVATAHFFDSTEDYDADGLPDWWEWHNFGGLTNTPSGDADGDGFNEDTEYRRDYNPRLKNIVQDGGISRRRSDLTLVNLAGYFTYNIYSAPPGFITSVSSVAQTGTVITTVNLSLANEVTGYYFSYWTLNGVPQLDSNGRALSRVQFMLQTNVDVVAHYIATTLDSDTDGLPDWWEWQNLGGLGQSGSADPDGDGMNLDTEYRRDYMPAIRDIMQDGGISRRRSEKFYLNMQFFERMEYALVDGILTNLFTVWPTNVTGIALGTNSVCAAGDWDGDGRLDLFTGSGIGQIRMFRNIGTTHTLNLTEKTPSFAGISSVWASITNPYPALGDFNGDGTNDLAVGGYSGRIRLVSSPGNFNNPQTPAVNYDLVVTDSVSALPAFCDITGNGRKDLLVLLDDGSVRAYTNTGNPLLPYDAACFTNNLLETSVPLASGISVADINTNGYPDVLVSDREGRIWEFQGSAGGILELKSKVWGGSGKGMATGLTIGAADLNGNGDIDAICGFNGGGLMYLRDPRVGRPDNVILNSGARSLKLTWDPNEEFRIKGYNLYRDVEIAGPFARLTNPKLTFPEYLDSSVTPGTEYFYYVTAVSQFIMPGNSLPRETESQPSDVVSGLVGKVTLSMADYSGMAGTTTVSSINISNSRDISGNSMEIRISYNPLVIRPVSQVIPARPTVERSALAQNISISDNGASATGELVIQGSGTGAVIGEGRILDVNWFITNSVPNGTKTTNTFTMAVMKDTAGNPLTVDITDQSVLTIQAAFIRGDITGDGIVNMDDFHACMDMAIGKITPNANQIKAGDLNGNGKLDKDDAHLILRLIQDLKINP